MIIDDANKLPSAVQEAASAVQQGTHHGPVDHGLPHTPQDMALVVHQPPNHDAGAYGRREDYERLGIVAHTGVAGPIVTRRKATNEILELLDPIHQDAVVMYEHELDHQAQTMTSSTWVENGAVTHQMKLEKERSARKKVVLLTPVSTVEVTVEEHGIRPEPNQQLFTKTPRQQLEGGPQDMALLKDFVESAVPVNQHALFLTHLEEQGKSTAPTSHHALIDLCKELVTVQEKPRNLALPAPSSSEIHGSEDLALVQHPTTNGMGFPPVPPEGRSPATVMTPADRKNHDREVEDKAVKMMEQLSHPLPRQMAPNDIDDWQSMQLKEFKILLQQRFKVNSADLKEFVRWTQKQHQESVGKLKDDDWFPTQGLFYNYASWIFKEKKKNNALYKYAQNPTEVKELSDTLHYQYYFPRLDELLELYSTPFEAAHFKPTILANDKFGKLHPQFKIMKESDLQNPFMQKSVFKEELEKWRSLRKSPIYHVQRAFEDVGLSLKSFARRIGSHVDDWKDQLIQIKEKMNQIFENFGKKIRSLILRKKIEPESKFV